MKIFDGRKVYRFVILITIVLCACWSFVASQSASTNRLSLDPVATVGGTDTSAQRIALYQALLDLQNPWTVMCVAAHPDDEDGTSLIVMRHKYGAHTVSLFSTFGEGGQNAIGPELYEEMGAIRARETMAAAEIQGSEPHFLGLKDFGFSKTRDEAFRFWGHEEALRRMVLEIRKLRPDVIITNHSTTSNDHGQHQATALMVVEAFDAAADPTKFPEQLKDGVSTWQVQRLFVRARGNQQQTNPQLVTIDPNEKDPVRGTMFAEEALRGLQQHATQGPWPKSFAEYANRFRAFSGQNAPTGQLPMIRYALVKSVSAGNTLPTNSHNFLDGLQLPDDLARHLAPPTVDGKPLTEFINDRELLIRKLTAFDAQLHGTQVLPFRVLRPIWATREALAAAAGVTAQLSLVQPAVDPGSNAAAKLELSNQGTSQLQVGPISTWLTDFNGEPKVLAKIAYKSGSVAAGETKTFDLTQSVPTSASITVPTSSHLYDNAWRGFTVAAVVNVQVNGTGFSLTRQASTSVAPPIEIASIGPLPLIIHDEVAASGAGVDIVRGRLPEVKVQLINHQNQPFRGEIVYGRDGGKEQTTKVDLLAHQNTTVALSIPNADRTVAAHARNSESSEMLSIVVRASGSRSEITKRTVPIVSVNAQVARNLRVGYVRGFDFSLPNALNALGVESKELSVDDVKTADLSQFTSVIVDNRVYESKPELIAANQKLLDYAQAGGNLIVFYHKSDEWNPDERRNRPQLAPYKLILGGERVTDENAPITFIEPDHPLLNTPNKIGQDDFKDWIQERGLYYPKEWDPQFHALLQSNDPGEQPLKGGLLVADFGKGHYIYTSMVWYRELRGGIPGAYRMLANMISYGQAEGKS
jgi:LmbE family N-acetylglucosaminyl deacetylase